MNIYECDLEDKNSCLFMDREDNIYIYSIKTIYPIATPRLLVYIVDKDKIYSYKLFLTVQGEIIINDNNISTPTSIEKINLLIKRNKEYIEKIYNINISGNIVFNSEEYNISNLDSDKLEFDNLICHSDDYKYSLYTYDFIDKEYSLLFCIFSKTGLVEFNISLERPEITYRFPEGNSYEILIDEELCLLQDMIHGNWDKITHIMDIIEKEEDIAEFNFDKQDYIKKYAYYHYTSIISEQYVIHKNDNIGISISFVGGQIYNKRYIGFEIFNYRNRRLIAIVDLDFNILFGEGNLYDNPDIIDIFYGVLISNISMIREAFDNELGLNITSDQVLDILRKFDNIKNLKRNLLPNPIYKRYKNTMADAYKRIAEEESKL